MANYIVLNEDQLLANLARKLPDVKFGVFLEVIKMCEVEQEPKTTIEDLIKHIEKGWHPIKDIYDLPKAYEPVLRSIRESGWNGTVNEYVDKGSVCPLDIGRVIAWQPLPEPYKKSEGANE